MWHVQLIRITSDPMLTLSVLLAAQTATPVAPPAPPVPACGYEIVREYPHDASSFTQGLFFHDGHLYESTGQEGRSRIARLDLATGKALAEARLPADQFGEGSVRWKDQIISVTWQNGVGHRWRLKDLKPVGTFRYSGEGWGLALLEDQLVWSDGSPTLRFFDPATMQEQRRVTVTYAGRPLGMLNELEAIDGEIWANIWMSDVIARIDPASGQVMRIVDLTGLKAQAGARGMDNVLNGIAWDAHGKRLFVTGKNWPKLFEIKLTGC